MSEGLSRALVRLEPDSGWEGVAHEARITPDFRVQLSIAISLKRIADVVADPHSVGGNFEDLAFQMGMAFANGKRSAGG